MIQGSSLLLWVLPTQLIPSRKIKYREHVSLLLITLQPELDTCPTLTTREVGKCSGKKVDMRYLCAIYEHYILCHSPRTRNILIPIIQSFLLQFMGSGTHFMDLLTPVFYLTVTVDLARELKTDFQSSEKQPHSETVSRQLEIRWGYFKQLQTTYHHMVIICIILTICAEVSV